MYLLIVLEIRRCPYIGACQLSLWMEHLNHTIEFFPNMTTTYDGYSYTVNQVITMSNMGVNTTFINDTFIISFIHF
jgi:hypothetical protein